MMRRGERIVTDKTEDPFFLRTQPCQRIRVRARFAYLGKEKEGQEVYGRTGKKGMGPYTNQKRSVCRMNKNAAALHA